MSNEKEIEKEKKWLSRAKTEFKHFKKHRPFDGQTEGWRKAVISSEERLKELGA